MKIFQFLAELSKDPQSFIFKDLQATDDRKVCLHLRSRLFFHFDVEQIKKCSECHIYLPNTHLKSSDHNIIERFIIYNPEEIENLTIQFIKRIPNKSIYDQVFGGKLPFDRFLNKQIAEFWKQGSAIDAKALINFKKKFENNVLLMSNDQEIDFEVTLQQKSNPSLEYLKSLKRILDKKTMQILSYYQKMQSLYKVYFEMRRYIQNQVKMIPKKQAYQFMILNNCHYGFANTEIQYLLDSNPLSVVEKVQSQLHSKSMSTDIYANIDLFSQHNLTKITKKINCLQKQLKIQRQVETSYSFICLESILSPPSSQKKLSKKLMIRLFSLQLSSLKRQKILCFELYQQFQKINQNTSKSKSDVEKCLFYIISNFESDKIYIDVIFKGQGVSIWNTICGGHFRQLRIERYDISIIQLKEMRKQNLLEDSSKIFVKFGHTVFCLKGLLKLIGKIEDNQSVYQQIYLNNQL